MIMTSNHSVSITLDRLTEIVEEKGITVFGRVDHAAGARKVGAEMRPTELLLFGNPKLGTPLMQANQQVGFDLPMRALAWQDEDGTTQLRVTDPSVIRETNNLNDFDDVIAKMTTAITNMAVAAAA